MIDLTYLNLPYYFLQQLVGVLLCIILPNFSTGAKVKEYCLSLH